MRQYSESWKSIINAVRNGESWSGNERNCFYLNHKGKKFIDVSHTSGLDFIDDSRAIGISDWDHDGDLDLIYKNRSAPRIRLITNEFNQSPSSILIKLEGTKCNRDGIGSRVELKFKNHTLMRSVKAGDMFLSQSTKWLHFALNSNDFPKEVLVYWNGGEREEFIGLNKKGHYLLVQGKGEAQQIHKLNNEKLINKINQKFTKQNFSDHVYLPVRFPFPIISYRGPDASLKTIDSYDKSLILNFWDTQDKSSEEELSFLNRNSLNFKKEKIEVVSLSLDSLENAGQAYEVIDKMKYKNEWGFLNDESKKQIQNWINKLFDRHESFHVPLSLFIDSNGCCIAIFKRSMENISLSELVKFNNLSKLDQWHYAPPLKGSWFTFPPSERFVRSFVQDRQK